MKKTLGIFVLGMIFISMSAGIVSAAGIVEGIQGIISGTYDIIEPVLSAVVGETGHGNIFVAKILFLIIIFAIVWKSLEKIPFFNESGWVLWIVSIAVSIVAVRWFGNAEIVTAVLLPYSALGITLTAGLPFILYFFVVKDFHKTTRKVAWIFFMIVFIGLWIMRSGDSGLAPRVGNFAYIYLATAGLAFLALVFDGTIHRWELQMHIDKAGATTNQEAIDKILEKKNKLADLLDQGIISDVEMRKRKKRYDKQMATLYK